ncbi:MAG TPA: AMP-binding protein, partial [Turneriella sp.]|nr:AMP-binding protein [Turneriella sp.]
LLDDIFQKVPVNTEGMLCIHESDPGLFLGYWQERGSFIRPIQNGWFLTGDYAWQNAEGYIFFMGRRDDILKSFGYRVSPFEIERVFRDHPSIEEVVAFGEKFNDEKMLIALAVKLKVGYTLNEAEILSWAEDKLARYKMPKKIYFRDSFPRSINGKIVRSKLVKDSGILEVAARKNAEMPA